MQTAAQEKRPKHEPLQLQTDNNVDQAFRDVYRFLLIEDNDVRSGDESLFDDPSSHEFPRPSDKYHLLNDRLK